MQFLIWYSLRFLDSADRFMDKDQIIELIKARRNELRDASSMGDASDPLVASASQVAWEKADEYDTLLEKIQAK
jgi:hypothetical protein